MQAEGRPQRVSLWCRKAVEAIEERRTDLMESGKREFHLRLDAGGPGDRAARRLGGKVLEQG